MTAALREQRQRRGLSLEQVGRRAGMVRTAVHAIETGVTAGYLDRLEALAEAVGARWSVRLVADDAAATDAELLEALSTMPQELQPGLLDVVRAWPALTSDDRELVAHLSARRAARTPAEVIDMPALEPLKKGQRLRL